MKCGGSGTGWQEAGERMRAGKSVDVERTGLGKLCSINSQRKRIGGGTNLRSAPGLTQCGLQVVLCE